MHAEHHVHGLKEVQPGSAEGELFQGESIQIDCRIHIAYPGIGNIRTSLPILLPQYEVLLVGEVIKMIYSAYKVGGSLERGEKAGPKLSYLLRRSAKMLILALIYGAMNILSFVALRNISAGMFTVFAQLKILTTATCSRQVSPRQVFIFLRAITKRLSLVYSLFQVDAEPALQHDQVEIAVLPDDGCAPILGDGLEWQVR